jgi:hypothetical protein
MSVETFATSPGRARSLQTYLIRTFSFVATRYVAILRRRAFAETLECATVENLPPEAPPAAPTERRVTFGQASSEFAVMSAATGAPHDVHLARRRRRRT